MALIDNPSIKFTTDKALFKYVNGTIYGNPELNRNDAGEYLFVAYINEKGEETVITVDSTPYLSKLEYDINNTIDGHYHFERLRFPNYNSGTSYDPETRDINDIISIYADLIFYSVTNKFYKNILTSTNIAPDAPNGSTYWIEITDFTDPEVRNNTNIINFIYDTIYDYRGRICVKDELYKISTKGCGCTDNLTSLMPYLKKKVYLSGARAKAADQKFAQAETITRVLDKLCPC